MSVVIQPCCWVEASPATVPVSVLCQIPPAVCVFLLLWYDGIHNVFVLAPVVMEMRRCWGAGWGSAWGVCVYVTVPKYLFKRTYLELWKRVEQISKAQKNYTLIIYSFIPDNMSKSVSTLSF